MLIAFSLGCFICASGRAFGADSERPPNVVLIISDDQAYDDFGFMGNRAVQTPNLDRLAARAACFTHAYVPTSVCRPSLATLLTGLYPHEHGIHFNHPPPGAAKLGRMARDEYYAARGRAERLIQAVPALPRILAAHGYRCLQTGKYWEGHYRTAGFTDGMTTGRAAGVSGCWDKVLPDGSTVAHGNGDAGLTIGRRTMQPLFDFLDAHADQPFFVWYAPVLPHTPHDVSAEDLALYENRSDLPPHDVRYYASITRFDRTVGQLLDYLDAKRLAANTLIVMLADNGWKPDPQRPDRAHVRSKWSPHEAGIRTPLLLCWEGRVRPARYDGIVESVDVAPTILAAAGLQKEARGMSGSSLLPVAEGKQPLAARPAFGEIYANDATRLGEPAREVRLRWVRSGRLKMIVPAEEPERASLFDVVDDPEERHDLAGRPEFAQDKARLTQRLDRWWTADGAPTPTANATKDEEPLTAVIRQRIHPVLIRNEENALLSVTIKAPRPGLHVTSFSFTLDGTDDPADLESLALFSTGDKSTFSTESPFGKPVRATETFVVHGDRQLKPGDNVFWLSCCLRDTANLSHRVDATCTAIETSAGVVSPRDLTPGIRKRIGLALRKHNDDGVHTYRIPALATTPKGTLLCVYDMRRRTSRDLQEDIDIGLSRSTDGGRTWEPQRVIMDMGQYGGLPQEQNGCSDPGILVDPQTGEVFVTAVWMWGKPGKHQWRNDGSEPGFEIGKSAQFLMVRSKDDGRTWSHPENMTRRLKQQDWILLAPSPQQGIAVADGTLVWPVQGRDAQDHHFSTVMTSRDHGATWTVGSALAVGNTECQAVVLGDGSLMLNCRTGSPIKFRSVYVSDDLGRTWRPHETHRNTLIEPNCNGSTYRFEYRENGQTRHILLFANPHSQEGRTHHMIQVSLDDGRTWPKQHQILLDEGRGRGYPSISRVDDRHVGIVYEGSQADLVFELLSLEELVGR